MSWMHGEEMIKTELNVIRICIIYLYLICMIPIKNMSWSPHYILDDVNVYCDVVIVVFGPGLAPPRPVDATQVGRVGPLHLGAYVGRDRGGLQLHQSSQQGRGYLRTGSGQVLPLRGVRSQVVQADLEVFLLRGAGGQLFWVVQQFRVGNRSPTVHQR